MEILGMKVVVSDGIPDDEAHIGPDADGRWWVIKDGQAAKAPRFTGLSIRPVGQGVVSVVLHQDYGPKLA